MNYRLLNKFFLIVCMNLSTALLYAQEQQPMAQAAGVIQLKTASELDSYLGKGRYAVVLFSSLTCGPCKSFHPIYQQLARDNSDVLFLEVVYGVTGGCDQLLNKYGVRAFPNFIFFDSNGNKTNSFSGANENSKSKIIGEIANLKAGTSQPRNVISEVQPQGTRPPSGASMQQPMPAQGAAQPVSSQPKQPVAMPQNAPCPMVQQPQKMQQPAAAPSRKRSSNRRRSSRRSRQNARVQQ